MARELDWGVLHDRLVTTDRVWIKKLSRNDRTWASSPEAKIAETARGHGFSKQNGVYIPADIRNSGFFPALFCRDPVTPRIFDADVRIEWLAGGEVSHSRVVHYSAKGAETHLTRIPKDQFEGIAPASLLIIGEAGGSGGIREYWAAALDSTAQDASLIETLFDLDATFHHGLFLPRLQLAQPPDETEQLIRELTAALGNGTLHQFIAAAARLPASHELALMAQAEYMNWAGLSHLNPFAMSNPGDAVMEISRDIEYSLYKKVELRHRAADVLRILVTSGNTFPEIAVRGFNQLGATFLSASQHRKSRAGRSFEHHIEALLRDGGISYAAQVVTGGRRPDFVMPAAIDARKAFSADSLVLSAKTTLRERWKQLTLEKFEGSLFLATVDDRVSAEAIADMARLGICLVVPESLKGSKETDYANDDNVITFRRFFDQEIRKKRPALITGVDSDLFGGHLKV